MREIMLNTEIHKFETCAEFAREFALGADDLLFTIRPIYEAHFAPLGLPGAGFSSADYFPLIPWCFVFAAGTVVGRLARDGKFPAWTYPSRVPFFSFLGRHALLIYIVHQPVIYGAGLLVQWIGSQL